MDQCVGETCLVQRWDEVQRGLPGARGMGEKGECTPFISSSLLLFQARKSPEVGHHKQRQRTRKLAGSCLPPAAQGSGRGRREGS